MACLYLISNTNIVFIIVLTILTLRDINSQQQPIWFETID